MLLALNFSHLNIHYTFVLETLMHYQHPGVDKPTTINLFIITLHIFIL
jgi:hypothetical protein